MQAIKIFSLFILMTYARKNYIVTFKRPTNASREEIKNKLPEIILRSQRHFSSTDKILKQVSYGYLALLSEDTAKKLEKDSEVAIVEEDKVVRATFLDLGHMNISQQTHLLIQHNAPWGLSRLSEMGKKSKNDYVFPDNGGEGVEVYIIDTGIMVDHPDFDGRARFGINLVEDSPDIDENGHGTHCAGIVGGTTNGVAKNVNLVAVKVLDKFGQGMISTIMEGIDFVIQEHEEKTKIIKDVFESAFLNLRMSYLDIPNIFSKRPKSPKTVINMSIGGEKSASLNYAIDYAVSLGIHISAAAGNESDNACKHSPGSSPNVITSGAYKQNNEIAPFSNTGNCVDVYAPGVDINSSWNDGDFRIASGTSMAAPHTSGVMALYLSSDEYSPKELKEKIIKDSKCIIRKAGQIGLFWPFEILFSQKLPGLSTHHLLNEIEDHYRN